ncbi:TetR/AcrR family transcriptional regulator [Propioniciclava coleopterorum]|uniref:TetR/AcrR family transcriptional regulator n=1 Tax=Propioniciclava coleopterorum TaxID=2714937 RepID=A0A6G7Y4A4_9ACTN|nr:TetR-like C-terminal domain-containing protein [Propioniciclava coleopterorum]QIK71468.1 TetR/AcrR family transcriptional regulator [Propioniciclava coleopterorum]
MSDTPRQRARARTMDDIVRIGRAHLATEGAAALSLRAVARDLGVVSSAVYRYVANRDELLTLLVVDAYTELADAVDAAVAAAASEGDLGALAEFGVLARAVRAWALAEPARYALLYGSPVPGYHAPAERTAEPGTRVLQRLVAILGTAQPRGGDGEDPGHAASGVLADDLASIGRAAGVPLSPAAAATGVLAWNAVLGAISAEVFGWYGDTFDASAAALFEQQLALIADLLRRVGVAES